MSKESYIKGFCKVAEAHGVDPAVLAKFAQQKLPMSSYNQRRIAELKAMAAKLKSGTPQSVTTNADGSVSSKWSGYFRGGKLVPQATAAQPQPTSPVQAPTMTIGKRPKLMPGLRPPRPGEYDSSWTANEDGSFSKGNTTSYPLDPNAILRQMTEQGIN